MESKKIDRSNRFFKMTREVLGINFLTKLWGRSKREIYAWGADPNHCNFVRGNPLEKINKMMTELQKKKRDDIVENGLFLLSENLGYKVVHRNSLKKNSLSIELCYIDFISKAGILADKIAYGKHNGGDELMSAIADLKRSLSLIESSVS
ncbi:MAG: hypothetical protein JRJ49_08685 [Deltaproteobacteria bacterium]|nr:hypothetical protein [Deltaproteobacteria bacterium]